MRRKLIKQGIGGQTISVPIKWVRKHQLKAGDELDLHELDDGLLVRPRETPFRKCVEVTIDTENESFIRGTINTLYRLGYEDITLRIQTEKQKQTIEVITEKYLLGFEVVSSSETEVLIQSNTEPSDEKQDVLLRRMIYLVKMTFEKVEEDIERSSYDRYQEIKRDTQKFNQFSNFCRRTVAKNRVNNPEQLLHLLLYQRLLFSQHSLLHMYESLMQENKNISSSTKQTFLDAKTIFFQISDGILKKKKNLIREYNEKASALLYDNVLIKLRNSSGIDTVVLHYVCELARLMYLLTMPVLGLQARGM